MMKVLLNEEYIKKHKIYNHQHFPWNQQIFLQKIITIGYQDSFNYFETSPSNRRAVNSTIKMLKNSENI